MVPAILGTAASAVAALVALAALASLDAVVLFDGRRVPCGRVTYESAPDLTPYEDRTLRCDDVRYRLGELRAVVTQR
jgi:hypothetical protein